MVITTVQCRWCDELFLLRQLESADDVGEPIRLMA